MLLNNISQKKTQLVAKKNDKSLGEKVFPSPAREWTNNLYFYNENTTKFIPYAESLTMYLIKSYFSIYNKIVQKKVRTKRMLNRLRKYSSNKIYISKAEFKHTNDKTIINLYVFNRQKYNYVYYMKR